MLRYRQIITYGFAIFSMFFGSGNLVFPLQIGVASGSTWFSGFLGLFLTGIMLPFLGLFVIKLHHGNYYKFFGEAGKISRFVVPLFTLSLLGAFGVVPRCITVAHGGIGYIFPEVQLALFSFLFCITCYVICLKDHFMISILGKWLTPILLVSLVAMIIFGVAHAPALENHHVSSVEAFSNGFLSGYETMDLFAAFFFSSLIFKQIQQVLAPDTHLPKVIRAALKPSFIGATLLSLVYLGFVYLGAYYPSVTANVSPELILPTIASHVLGKNAALLIGIIVVFSCLTTAVALNNIYARYLCSLLKVGDKKFPWVLLATTIISYFISLMNFKGIAAFLEPALEVSYPSLIVLTFLSILFKEKKQLKRITFYGILVFSIGIKFFTVFK